MIVFKNILSFGLTFEAFKWLVTMGTKATPLFIIVGSIQVAVCLSSIPMCKWTKPSEIWFHDMLTFFYHCRHLWQEDASILPSQ